VNALKKALFEAYGGFADKRIKKLESGSIFVVDDRSDGDRGADGKLYGYFCLIFAEVRSNSEVLVTLSGNVPMGSSVRIWITKHEASLREGVDRLLSFVVSKKEGTSKLSTLADAIASIVARGARYDVKSHKYVCPRTADSLQRLDKVLRKAWSA